MFGKIVSSIAPVVRWLAVVALFAAGYALQHQRRRGWSITTADLYRALALAAFLLAVLWRVGPGFRLRRVAFHPLTIPLYLALSVALCAFLCGFGAGDPMVTDLKILLWLAAGAAFVCACHAWESRAAGGVRSTGLSQRDWWFALAAFAIALLVRSWGLGTEVPALAFDETIPLSRTQVVLDRFASPFYVDDMSMPTFFHHFVRHFSTAFAWLGFDLVQTAKLANIVLASLSVPFFMLFVRLVAGPSMALATAGFLILQNWHWLYSRFYYLYAGDLLWIALASFLAVAGGRSRRISLLALAGMVAGVGLAWWKTAILAGPWVALILIERGATDRYTRWWRTLAHSLAALLAFAIMTAPVAVEANRRSDTVWRFADVTKHRDMVRERHGLTTSDAHRAGVLSIFRVLQVSYGDFGRYSLRGTSPILNFVTSSLATVGFFWSILNLVRRRSARLSLLGFLVFMLPAVLSYPQDMPASIPRRALGVCFFSAWLTAQGAWVIAAALFLRARQRAAVAALILLSTLLNAHTIRVGNPAEHRRTLWNSDVGVAKVLILRELDRSRLVGPVFYHLKHPNLAVHQVAKTFGSRVRYVEGLEQLRGAVESQCRFDGWFQCSVLLPWGADTRTAKMHDWVEALADIIPPSAWRPGPLDPAGVPVYRIAHFVLPVEAGNDPSPAPEVR